MYQSPAGPSVPTERAVANGNGAAAGSSTRKTGLAGGLDSAVPEEDERSMLSPSCTENAPWFAEEEFTYDDGCQDGLGFSAEGADPLKEAPTPMDTSATSPSSHSLAHTHSRLSAVLLASSTAKAKGKAAMAAMASSSSSSSSSSSWPSTSAGGGGSNAHTHDGPIPGGPLTGLPADASDALMFHAGNGSCRPPYAYTAMIYMAVHAINHPKVQLGEIYNQIQQSWAYYRARPSETGWKNSIRHNLTVSRCFKKVARAEGEAGKGGYWIIDEGLAKIDILLSPRVSTPKLSKKLKKKKAAAAQRSRSRSTFPAHLLNGMLEFADEATSPEVRIAAASVPMGTQPGHSTRVVLGGGSADHTDASEGGGGGGGGPMSPTPADEDSLGLSDSFSIAAGMLGSSMNVSMASSVLGQSFSSVLARGCLVDA